MNSRHDTRALPRLSAIGALTFALLVAPAAFAASPASPSGLFEGALLRDIGPEPVTLQFDRSGGMRVLSALEPNERESTGLGMWRDVPGGGQEFGYISYREGGDWLCDGFTGDEGECTLVVTGNIAVDSTGMLTGDIAITVKDRSDGGDNYTIGPLSLEAQRVSIEDLKAVHD